MSLALAVAAMIERQRFHSAMQGVDVSAHATHVEDFSELGDALSRVEKVLPQDQVDVLPWWP